SPDEVKGNIVKAFIVLADGHEASDDLVKDIQRHVRERLSAYAYPRKIEFVDDLPKTLTGKIRRIELREREMEAAKQEPAGEAGVGLACGVWREGGESGVVGPGFMVAGIGESAAGAGLRVRVYEPAPGPLQ